MNTVGKGTDWRDRRQCPPAAPHHACSIEWPWFDFRPPWRRAHGPLVDRGPVGPADQIEGFPVDRLQPSQLGWEVSDRTPKLEAGVWRHGRQQHRAHRPPEVRCQALLSDSIGRRPGAACDRQFGGANSIQVDVITGAPAAPRRRSHGRRACRDRAVRQNAWDGSVGALQLYPGDELLGQWVPTAYWSNARAPAPATRRRSSAPARESGRWRWRSLTCEWCPDQPPAGRTAPSEPG